MTDGWMLTSLQTQSQHAASTPVVHGGGGGRKAGLELGDGGTCRRSPDWLWGSAEDRALVERE